MFAAGLTEEDDEVQWAEEEGTSMKFMAARDLQQVERRFYYSLLVHVVFINGSLYRLYLPRTDFGKGEKVSKLRLYTCANWSSKIYISQCVSYFH